MKIVKNSRKATVKVFVFSAIYYSLCSFIFIFMINNVIIELITSGKINISRNDLIYLSVVSVIVGVAAGCRIWIFAKLDERKARKSPPSDEDQD